MSVYALIPLFVTIAYVPLLVTSLTNRPWTKQQGLFVIFLLMAMLWSFSDYIFRTDFAPAYRVFLLRCVVLFFTLTAVQYHVFASSFYASGQSRWLSLAYVSLGIGAFAVFFGGAVNGVNVNGEKVYPEFGLGIVLIALPLLVLAARNVYVFLPRLRHLDNPALYKQNQWVTSPN